MSSYHSSFKYLNKKSDEDFGWIISHFDPDNGETDSYLSQDQIYTDSYNGAKRTLYGTKWNSVANVKITVIKHDGSDFTLGECREAYKWLTGNPEASWMDLYIGDEVKYRLLCTIQDVKPQKMDARTVGLNIYCESLSPWAYSPMQTITKSFTGANGFTINNDSDDMYSFIYPKVIYENTDGTDLFMRNDTINETTNITSVEANEVITLHPNQFITSDNPNKTFGNTFNFVWPRLKSGINNFSVNANGKLTFEYYYPIKMGDCAQNINIVRDPICDDFNNIQVDTLPWERVSGTPNTLSGYGISDAYTKNEIDSNYVPSTRKVTGIDLVDDITAEELQNALDVYPVLVRSSLPKPSEMSVANHQFCLIPREGSINKYDLYVNFSVGTNLYRWHKISIDAYTKTEIDEKFANIDANIDTYTKAEIDEKLNNITASGVDISEEELNTMLNDVLGE